MKRNSCIIYFKNMNGNNPFAGSGFIMELVAPGSINTFRWIKCNFAEELNNSSSVAFRKLGNSWETVSVYMVYSCCKLCFFA